MRSANFEQQTKQAGELQALQLEKEYAARDAEKRVSEAERAGEGAKEVSRRLESTRAADRAKFETALAEQAAALQRASSELAAATSERSAAVAAHERELRQLQLRQEETMRDMNGRVQSTLSAKDATIRDLRQQLAEVEEVFSCT